MSRKLLKAILVGLIALMCLLSVFVVVKVFETRRKNEIINSYVDDNFNLTEINGKYYKEKDNLELILCVGLDTYQRESVDDYTNDNFADFITLLIVDKKKNTTLPIQINRDTMCDIDILGIGGKLAGKAHEQLAYAHTYGNGDMNSLVNVKNAVSDLLHDIKIDYYLSLTMSSVVKINDEVGGVTVLVEDDFSSIDPSIKKGEYITLLGDQALSYVRARQGLDDTSNTSRMKRQRAYLRALYEQCKSKSQDDNYVYNIIQDIGNDLVANCSVYDLSDLGNLLLTTNLLDAISLEGESVKGIEFMEYYVDQKTIDDLCTTYIFDEVKK